MCWFEFCSVLEGVFLCKSFSYCGQGLHGRNTGEQSLSIDFVNKVYGVLDVVWGVAYQRCQDIGYVFGYIVRDRVYVADNGPEQGPFFMDLGESILARN